MIGEVFLREELIDWRGAQYLSIVLQRNSVRLHHQNFPSTVILSIFIDDNKIRSRTEFYSAKRRTISE
jgi:hypothetical protein